MATEAQARETWDTVHKFYKRGIKSSNKTYVRSGPDMIYSEEVLEKHKRRKDNAELSLARRQNFGGQLAEVAGASLYNSGNTAGNCGEMALVAMFVAVNYHHVQRAEVVHVTAKNTNHKAYSFKGEITLDFGHSWIEIGPTLGVTWVVDPWADLWCRKDQFPQMMAVQLQKWTDQGKRLSVSWKDTSMNGWKWTTQPNAVEVKAVLAHGAQHSYIHPLDNI
jgi:hypothetical protein